MANQVILFYHMRHQITSYGGRLFERERQRECFRASALALFCFWRIMAEKVIPWGLCSGAGDGELPSMLWAGASSSGPLAVPLPGRFPFRRPLWLPRLPLLLPWPGWHWLIGPPLYFLGGGRLVLTKWPDWPLFPGCWEEKGSDLWVTSWKNMDHYIWRQGFIHVIMNRWTNSNKAWLELQRNMFLSFDLV